MPDGMRAVAAVAAGAWAGYGAAGANWWLQGLSEANSAVPRLTSLSRALAKRQVSRTSPSTGRKPIPQRRVT
jgi:hypothetical protein